MTETCTTPTPVSSETACVPQRQRPPVRGDARAAAGMRDSWPMVLPPPGIVGLSAAASSSRAAGGGCAVTFSRHEMSTPALGTCPGNRRCTRLWGSPSSARRAAPRPEAASLCLVLRRPMGDQPPPSPADACSSRTEPRTGTAFRPEGAGPRLGAWALPGLLRMARTEGTSGSSAPAPWLLAVFVPRDWGPSLPESPVMGILCPI